MKYTSPIPVCIALVLFFASTGALLSHAEEGMNPSGVVEFHVATGGRDDQDGTPLQPFATLGRAQLAARGAMIGRATKPVTIWIHPGIYELEAPLIFTAEDGGTELAPVTWAAKGEKVVLSGGSMARAWEKVDGDLWRWRIPAARNNQLAPPRAFWLAGERQTRARHPNRRNKFLHGLTSEDGKSVRFPDNSRVNEAAGKGGEFVLLAEWLMSRQRLPNEELKPNTVQFPSLVIPFFNETWAGGIRADLPNMRFYIEGAAEFLDEPGEWWFDAAAGENRYLAAHGVEMGDQEATVPRLERLLVVSGTIEKPVRHLHFRGLHFAYTNFRLPKDGFIPTQACMAMDEKGESKVATTVERDGPPSAVRFVFAERCSLVGGSVSHIGGTAISVERGCQGVRIERNEVFDAEANGIQIGELASLPPEKELVNDCVVADNHVHHCGAEQAGAVGIWAGIAAGTVVERNHVHDLPYSGISAGWSWVPQATACVRTTIARNHVHHVCQLLSDGGGIYAPGWQPDSVMRGNYIHDIAKRTGGVYKVVGIYFDDAHRGWRVEENIIHDTPEGSVGQNSGHPQGITWGTNYFDITPQNASFPRDIVNRAGPKLP